MRKAKVKKLTTPAADQEAVFIPETRGQVPVYATEIPVDAVYPSRFQPRQTFPDTEIDQLAASIAESGLVHPIAVREAPDDPDHYELVDGERRWRAYKRLGLATIRAELGEYSDAQVMEIVVATAIQRKELNPIEEALAFQRAIEAGVAAGPTELARQLGVSQGHVSNRIRLLELPAEWRGRLISGEIPPTHARSLLKYAAYPTILDAIAEDLEKQHSDIHGCDLRVEDFDEALTDIAIEASEQLAGEYYDSKMGRRLPVFTPTPDQLRELKVIELQTRWSKPQKRATNVKLWEQLQEEFLKSRDAKAEKKAAKVEAKAKQPKKELTPAEKKAAEAEERRKAKEREKQFQKRLYEWYLDWLRYLIAQRLRTEATMQELLVIAVYFRTVYTSGNFEPLSRLKDVCKTDAPDVTVKTKSGHWGKAVDAIDALTQLGEMEIEGVLGKTMAEWFCSAAGEPYAIAHPEDLAPLATYLGIIRSVAWADDQAGPLSQRYWSLHSKEQLVELAEELGVEVDAAAKKSDLVAAFVARNEVDVDQVPMPAELGNVKRPK